jgi:hypothetical protein
MTKLPKKNTIFVEKTSKFESTNQTLDAKYAYHQIQ